MNKQMKKLYADIESLNDWVQDLGTKHKENPENEETYSKLLMHISYRVLDLMEQIDKEREIYRSQPLWKQLLGR